MRYITHRWGGREQHLSCTAQALFALYDKFGSSPQVLETAKIYDNSTEGWANTVWLYCLLARQGELQRRLLGEDPAPILREQELMTLARPGEVPGIRQAIRDALEQGFRRELPDGEEVDLGLLEIEAQEKKTPAEALSGLLTWLRARAGSTSAHGTPSC